MKSNDLSKVDEERCTEMAEPENNTQIFSTNDERLKFLGEILGNESSRKILTLLIAKESTIMNISIELNLSPNLIIHHLKKMIQSGIVTVIKESVNKRGRPLRFYRAKQSILIFSKDAHERAKKSKSLLKTVTRIARFTAIGLAGVFTWMTTATNPLDVALKYPRPGLPPYMDPIESFVSPAEFIFPFTMAAIAIIVGLVINKFLSGRLFFRLNS